MWDVTAQSPNFYSAIQTRTGKCIGVFGIDFHLHDIMGMSFEQLRTIEIAIPIPQFDCHIIGTAQYVGEGRMNFQRSDVIGMGFKIFDFFHGIVIEHTHPHIVGRCEEPLFPCDEFRTSHWQFRHFKRFDQTATVVIPNHHIATVQGRQYPWFRMVQINRFDTFRGGGQFLFNVQTKRLVEGNKKGRPRQGEARKCQEQRGAMARGRGNRKQRK